MKILLTGGGTAGHVWPIIAIAQNLQRNARVKFLFVGSRQGPEKKIARHFHIPFNGLIVGKWRTYFSLANFWDLFKTLLGLIQAFFILLFFQPNVVFAKGGYVTFPILFWLQFFKTPLVIHESDVIMGKANQWAAQRAQKVCVGFSVKFYPDIPLEKLVFTGIPVRQEFFHQIPQKPERPTLLITGGSQGSHRINETILAILPELLEKFDIYHLSGKIDYQKFSQSTFSQNPHYHLESFSENMPEIMTKADLIISRAGATTFAEIGALGKPSILIPYPAATADHQTANAKIYQEASAAVVISEKNLTSSSILSIINRLIEDNELRQILGHHSRQFAQKEAAQEIIDILFEVANQSRLGRA